MPPLIEILQFLGIIAVLLLVIIGIMMLGYYQTTRKMTPEEKKAFDKYIKENGIFGADDDY